MEKKKYPTVSQNLLNNFLIPLYRWTMVTVKEKVVSDINERSPFMCEYDGATDVAEFFTGESVIKYKFTWEATKQGRGLAYTLKKIEEAA